MSIHPSRLIGGSIAVFMAVPAMAQPKSPPEPTTIVGKCNKEVGGYYDAFQQKWFVREYQVAAKNRCVTRMMNEQKANDQK